MLHASCATQSHAQDVAAACCHNQRHSEFVLASTYFALTRMSVGMRLDMYATQAALTALGGRVAFAQIPPSP